MPSVLLNQMGPNSRAIPHYLSEVHKMIFAALVHITAALTDGLP